MKQKQCVALFQGTILQTQTIIPYRPKFQVNYLSYFLNSLIFITNAKSDLESIP